jgi:m7GpppX diphosphatase
MEFIYDSTKEKFIPNTVLSFPCIRKIKVVMENDSFTKYEAIAEVKGEYIVCNDITKLKKYSNLLIKESYEEYLDFLSKRDIEKDRWIYNIIDGIAECDKIIYRDLNLIVIPTYTWDTKNIDKLHILCLPTNKNIRTIRDLTSEHIPLLQRMKDVTLETIEKIYGLTEENLKIFFHYEPSTYHLHIHFINTVYTKSLSSVEYSHDLDSVIFNLSIDSDYYKKIKLNRRI